MIDVQAAVEEKVGKVIFVTSFEQGTNTIYFLAITPEGTQHMLSVKVDPEKEFIYGSLEDRLVRLAEDLVQDILKRRKYDEARRQLESAKRRIEEYETAKLKH